MYRYVLLCLLPLLTAATYRSQNFVVDAKALAHAQTVAEAAEVERRRLASHWLGQELPEWKEPCPIRVEITLGESGGTTSFGFRRGKVADQNVVVEGRLPRILASGLPHEVTHLVLAHHFGAPIPRWADEGLALLSEDRQERERHDAIMERLWRRGDALPLKTLFAIEEYPEDLMGFYAQSFEVTAFLLRWGGKDRFLRFLSSALAEGWDAAILAHYRLADRQALDEIWQKDYERRQGRSLRRR